MDLYTHMYQRSMLKGLSLRLFVCQLTYTLPLSQDQTGKTIRSNFLAYQTCLGLSGGCEHVSREQMLCVEANNIATTQFDQDSNSGLFTPNESRTDALDRSAAIAALKQKLFLVPTQYVILFFSSMGPANDQLIMVSLDCLHTEPGLMLQTLSS